MEYKSCVDITHGDNVSGVVITCTEVAQVQCFSTIAIERKIVKTNSQHNDSHNTV